MRRLGFFFLVLVSGRVHDQWMSVVTVKSLVMHNRDCSKLVFLAERS